MKTNTHIIALLFFSSVALFSSCKHEPMVLPASDSPVNSTDNGNSNGNQGNTSTCDPDSVYFQNVILPLFVTNCAVSNCHDAQTHKEGIVLDSYINIMMTGDIRAFDPNHGKIYRYITTTNTDDRMPPSPRNALSPTDAGLIAKWINQGALNNACYGGNDNCDTSNVTYSGTIAPLLQSRCTGCHSGSYPGGNINLTAHSGVQAVALNGHLLGSINHNYGYSAMPKNLSKLPDCQIAQVRIWIENGSLNN